MVDDFAPGMHGRDVRLSLQISPVSPHIRRSGMVAAGWPHVDGNPAVARH
jgi:hypothetical protein